MSKDIVLIILGLCFYFGLKEFDAPDWVSLIVAVVLIGGLAAERDQS